jgi:hypothetical protein
MSDTNEPSPASAGSHGKVTVSLHTDDSACAFPNSRPIRRQRFTLTDAERAAIAWCVEMAETTATECDEELAALRGLLSRTT